MKSVGNTECLKSPCWRSCFKVITWTFGEKWEIKKPSPVIFLHFYTSSCFRN